MLKGKTRQRKAAKKRTTKPRITATTRAVRTAQILSEKKGISMGAAMVEAGYSAITAANPQQLTRSKGWQELMDEYLPEGEILEVHKGLLKASRVDHLVFTASGEPSDDEIKAMLLENNCRLRKIVHGETARHVYFFAADNKARATALDMAYKLRGTYAAEKHLHVGVSLVELHALRNKELAATPQAPRLDTPDVEE